MLQHNLPNNSVVGISTVAYPVALTHIERAVRIPEWSPHVDESHVRSANLRQVFIHQPGALDALFDAAYCWEYGVKRRWHSLRRGGDDVAMHASLLAEYPDPLDISRYYTGDHRGHGDAMLLGELRQVGTNIHFAEAEQNIIAGAALERGRDAELSNGMEGNSSKFVGFVGDESQAPHIRIATS